MEDFIDDEIRRIARRIKRIRGRIEEDIDRYISEIEREVSELESIIEPGFDARGRIIPLHTVEDLVEFIKILIDMPDVDENSINIDFEENIMRVRGRIKRRIRISSWTVGDDVEFSEYEAIIELPTIVDDRKRVRTRLVKGFLEVLIYK